MPNRLARESSPYLRQHAHNPVEWYPWGDEALAAARRDDKPILLSIGYSACHWCHVMERESFEDASIAALMNEHFVCVKVDREERPDLDQIYQLVVQMMGRSGGWPLTVFLTPEKQPFFGGTYFPPADRHGMPGLPTVLRSVHEAWTERRGEIEQTAAAITDDIAQVTSARGDASDVPRDVARRAADVLAKGFDEAHGGFGDRPKFPNTMALDVMLRAAHDGDEASLARVKKALDAMRAGGIWDHLGGGFHRYSTDPRWMVPHFEKMLYDNALLLRLYADGWRATGDERYAETARGITSWLEREMRSPEGAFYATQDADTEGEEGKFFVWKASELDAILDDEESAVARLCFGVTAAGNFESTGATVLHANRDASIAARQLGIDVERARETLERARSKMFAARERRPRPFRDEKVIATWNGLMIGALADAGGALGDARMVELARDAFDQAVPSGTSSIVHALLRLASHLGEERYERIAERVMRAHASSALRQPQGFGHLLGAMDRAARGATEVIVVAPQGDAAGESMRALARRAWLPNRVLARVDPSAGETGLAQRLGGKRQQGGVATAFVCRERTCSLPVTTPEALEALLTRP